MKKYLYPILYSTLALQVLGSQYIIAGDLDETFGGSGTGVIITEIQRINTIQSSTIQIDDKIVATGSATGFDQELTVARYTDNGLLDTSLNGNGIQTLLVGTATMGNAIDLQSDAKMVVCGSASENQTNIIVARYTTSGILDPTFNGVGYVTTSTGTGAMANSLRVQTDGKIVIGGTAIFQNTPRICLVRYNSDGSLDGAFGPGGTIITEINDSATLNQIALQNDGKIVGVGYVQVNGITKFAIVRYNTDGSLDNTFGTSGITTTEIGPSSIARAIAIQSDGRIIAVGNTEEDRVNKFAIARYTASGNLDPTFNTTGIVTTQVQYNDIAYAVVLQSNGSILVGGSSVGNNAQQFALARYTTSGTLDTTFGTNGIVTTTIEGRGSESQINTLVLQSNEKIVATGFSDESFALTRYVT